MNPLLNKSNIHEVLETQRALQREELRKKREAYGLRKDGTNKYKDRPAFGRRKKKYKCALCGYEWEDEAGPSGVFPKPSARCRNQKTCFSSRWQDGRTFTKGPQPRPGRQGVPLGSGKSLA